MEPLFTPLHDRLPGSDAPGGAAIIGNPPFQGGQKITGEHGVPYRDLLVEYLVSGRRGSADVCAYFFLRGASLPRPTGQAGLLAVNAIAQVQVRGSSPAV